MTLNPNPQYAELTDEEIAAEQPLTESKMIRLRDNPRATYRNDPSVPDTELQLGEGMRTDMTDGNILVAQSGKLIESANRVSGTSQYMTEANVAFTAQSSLVTVTAKKIFNIAPGTQCIVGGDGAPLSTDLTWDQAETDSTGSILLVVNDFSSDYRKWAANLLSLSYDDYITPTTFTMVFKTIEQFRLQSTPPVSLTQNANNVWRDVFDIDDSGTGAELQVRSDGNYIQFRVRGETSINNDTFQATINVQTINYGV